MIDVKIRKARVEDMLAVNNAHKRSIREVCSKDYNADQIEKCSDITYTVDRWTNTVSNECCYIVELDDEIHGVCHSKVHDDNRGEIVGLYLTPEVIGLGVGRSIFTKCLDYIKEHSSRVVFISGTLTAKGFYEKMGFKSVKKVNYNIRGIDVEIHRMEMEIFYE